MTDPVVSAVLALALAIATGALASGTGALGDRDAAIAALNAFGIRVAFPALVLGSLARVPDAGQDVAAWLVGPVAVVLALAVVAVARRVAPPVHAAAGPIALVVAFGNVAYLGMPLGVALLGEEHAGTVALAASAHVAIAVTAGPLLLARWSDRESARAWWRVLAQPLFASVLLGLALRWAPAAPRDTLVAIVTPIGATAAPVGAFVLGAYLERHRGALLRAEPGVLLATAARLALVPAIALGLAHVLVSRDLLAPIDARLAVLLAAMPAAISTFSIAHDEGQGIEPTAGAIVLTTVLSALTVPVWLLFAP